MLTMRMMTTLIVVHYTFASSQCESSDDFSSLRLSTSQRENDDLFDFIIFDNCVIDKYWTVKPHSYSSINQILEDKSISRRLLRFDYDFKAHSVLSISLSIEAIVGYGEAFITQSNFALSPGDSFDSFIEYQCKKRVNNYYSRFKVTITMKTMDNSVNEPLSYDFAIQLTKICEHYNRSTIDISHLFVIFICMGIVIACVYESFSSKIEEKIQNKIPEIRNPENLAIISIIIAIVLFFLYIVNGMRLWIYFSLFILVPLSIAMILEPIFKGTQCKGQMSNRTFEIDFIGSLSMFTLIGLFVGLIIFIFWIIFHFWIINDIIVIVFAIESIRIFKFTSFKFISFISLLLWLYDLSWFFFHWHSFNDKSRLTTQFNLSLPVLILCPEFDAQVFPTYNALGLADVIMPGILINYLYRFDKKTQYNSKLYFIVSSGVYVAGLFLRIYAYCYWYLSVPAFLISFPLIMTIVLTIAVKKGDFSEMIEGFKSTVFAEDELGSRKLDQFAQEAIYDSNDDNMTTEMKVMN